MGYGENTAVSPIGQKLLNDLFDLIYLQSEANKNTVERMINNSSQMKDVVENFRDNSPRIVTIMKRFFKGNTHVGRDDAGDSGIFVCNPIAPFGAEGYEAGCGRRDHLWWWEFLDFGVYSSYSEWGSSIGLNRWPHYSIDPTWDNGQLIVARVRCNSANTCDTGAGGCGTTWLGTGSCPNTLCENKQRVTTGCGKTSYMVFHTKIDKPVSSYWRFTSGPKFRNGAPIAGARAELPRNTVATMVAGSQAEDNSAARGFYRFYWAGLPPQNTWLNSFDACMSHIPYIQIGYRSQTDPLNTRPGGYTCNGCQKLRMAPKYDESESNVWNKPFEIYNRITTFHEGNYPGDQHGGLCLNIGDVARPYAGLDGMFGCECGGVYEPNVKIGAITTEDFNIDAELVQAGLTQMGATAGSMGGSIRGVGAGSGAKSNLSIYGRGSVDYSARNAVYERYGAAKCMAASNAVKAVKEEQMLRRANAYPLSIPISKCRYGFVYSPLKVCRKPLHVGTTWRNPSTGQDETNANYYPLINPPRGRGGHDQEQPVGAIMDYCPECGPEGDAKYITTHPSGWLAPARPLTITSSQPFTKQNSVGIIGRDPSTGQAIAIEQTFLEKPQWTIVLRDMTDKQERFNLRLELPQAYIGDIIQNTFTPQPPPPTNDNRPEGFTCPNEKEGPLKSEVEWLNATFNAATEEGLGNPDNLADDELLVTAQVNEGDNTVTVHNGRLVNVGDFISGGPFGIGTNIVNIVDNTLTVQPAAQSQLTRNRDALGNPIRQTQYDPPFVIKFVRNRNAANPLFPTCCNGVQSPQYTFLVTEGKSASAFYQSRRGWIDTSPLCNYGNRKGLRWTEVDEEAAELTNAIHTDVQTMGSMFPHPLSRTDWEAMQEDDPSVPNLKNLPSPINYGSEYQWCDLDAPIQNQMVQDMFANSNRMLRSVLNTITGGSSDIIQGSHSIRLVEEEEVTQSGQVQKYYKCRTCEAIADIGRAAKERGDATSLVEALATNNYYPGYAAIRYYQSIGKLLTDNRLIQPDGTLRIIPDPAGGMTEGYLDGAVDWEQKNLIDAGPGWWNWAIRYRQELAEGGDYRYN